MHRARRQWQRWRSPPEISEEIAFHLEMLTERYEREGMKPAEARLRALERFGDVRRVTLRSRRQYWIRRLSEPFDPLLGDLSDALRSARARPKLTTLSILALAVVLGFNGAAFAVTEALAAPWSDARGDASRLGGDLVRLGAILLLVLTSTHLALLHLARGLDRRPQALLRRRLGASRTRLIRVHLVHGALLGSAAGMLGAGLAGSGVARLAGLVPAWILHSPEVTVRPGLYLAAMVAGLLCGLGLKVPVALAVTAWSDPSTAFPGRRRSPPRSIAALQAGLAFVLLAGALLLGKSLLNLRGVDPGFDIDGVLTLRIAPNPADYPGGAAVDRLADRLATAWSAVPGVRSVTWTNLVPASRNGNTNAAIAFGGELEGRVNLRAVSPGLLPSLGVKRVSGRRLRTTDTRQSPAVVVINQRMAAWLSEHTSASESSLLGRHLVVDALRREIVGVAADLQHFDLRDPMTEMIYVPLAQTELRERDALLHVSGTLTKVASAVRAASRRVDPALSIYDVKSLRGVVEERGAAFAVLTRVLLVLAALAALLAPLSVYSLSALAAAARRREQAVRRALGAGRIQLGWRQGRETWAGAGAGLAAGFAVSAALNPALEEFLFGVSAFDLPIYSLSFVILAGASWAAGLAALSWPDTEILRSDDSRK